MSRSSKSKDHVVASVVVSGPLGPWRLSIAVGVSTVLTGLPLADAVSTGELIDLALGRSFAVALVVWASLGAINRVLAQVEAGRALDARSAADAPAEWGDAELGAPPTTGTAA